MKNMEELYRIVTSKEWEVYMIPLLEERRDSQINILLASEDDRARTKIKVYNEIITLPEYILAQVNKDRKGVDRIE